MTDLVSAGQFRLGDRSVNRMGYGAMQLCGEGVFGPPRDRTAAIAVLRAAVLGGVNHIDTSDYYGPHITNQIIREALHPYPSELTIVTKAGARRGDDGSWLPAQSPADLVRAVEDNLRALAIDAIDVINLRRMDHHGVTKPSITEQMETLARLQQQGLIRHIGVSHVSAAQTDEARKVAPIVCVQNEYNIANRKDDALIDDLAAQGIAFVPYSPLGGVSPLQSDALSAVAARFLATPMQIALAWLLKRSPNILLIPGTSSIDHLRENLAAASLTLDEEAARELDLIDPATVQPA